MATEQAGERLIDMRECPLDTITFIDPWVKGTFEVTRVGTNYRYACGSGASLVVKADPSPEDECKGPYGDLVLEGTYRLYEDAEMQTVSAIYSIIPGSPCCGWSSVTGTDNSIVSRSDFKWFAEKDMPLLRDVPFASIDPDQPAPDREGEKVISNPLIALKCRLPAVR